MSDPDFIEIVLTPGVPSSGHWCNKCLKPSVIEVPVYTVSDEGGISRLGMASSCTEREET